MERKISFFNMDHSDPMEQHALEKLNKIDELLKRDKDATPMFLEMRLTAHPQHVHHQVELHLKTPNFDLNSHEEHADMYVAIDNTIDKMVALVKKEKARLKDKEKKASNDKRDFESDKYTL